MIKQSINKKLITILFFVFGIILLSFGANAASSYGQVEFKEIYKLKAKGEIKITGNVLMEPSRSLYSSAQIDSWTRGNGSNNSYFMGYVDVDNDSSTRNSSSAYVSMANNASVEKAYLIWGGASLAGSGNGAASANNSEVEAGPKIKFKTPAMNAYTLISPTEKSRLTIGRKDFTAYADVTALVKDGGSGNYWAGDLPLATGGDSYGGWSLVIVYKDETKPVNDMRVFYGYQIISQSNPTNITITGLVTPPAGQVHAKVGIVSWEGDQGYTGDIMTIGKTASVNNPTLSDAGSPARNFFYSKITDNGNEITNRNPYYINNLGMDAKVINIDGKLDNKQDTVGFSLTSQGDAYYPTVLTTEIEQYSPDIKIVKSVKNISRSDGLVREGDILEYTLDMKNIGFDTATLTVATDTLPDGVDYVSNSIVNIVDGKPISKTDKEGDDNVEYKTASKNIQIHVGSDSSSNQGGKLVYNQQEIYKYRVKVNAKGINWCTNF